MNYKVLKHKTKPGIYGNFLYREGLISLYESTIPKLFGLNHSINLIDEDLDGGEDINNFDLIPVQLLTILP